MRGARCLAASNRAPTELLATDARARTSSTGSGPSTRAWIRTTGRRLVSADSDRTPIAGGALATDLRFQLFAVVFAVGTIAHELRFLLEIVAVGPLTEYMERWGRAMPALLWPSWSGLALHLGDIALALGLLVVPRKREGICLLAVVFLASQLASPNRSSSHSSLMIGGLLMVLVLALGEWGERLVARRHPGIDWLGATHRGLAWICALTYFFAFFYKLNRGWFSASSSGPSFLQEPLGPILSWLDAPAMWGVVGAVAIYGTLVMEVALPCLLFLPRTRRLGCFLGAAFHLPMMMRGVIDFPLLILAFYPAFLKPDEGEELCGWLRHLSWGRLVAAAALGGHGLWVLANTQRARITAARGLPWIPTVVVANAVLTGAMIVMGAYLTLVLGAWWWAGLGGRRGVVESGVAPSPRRAPGARRPAVALALTVVALCAANQLAPFFRLPAAGPLVMFSDISPDYRNHLILPGIPLVSAFEYVRLLRFEGAAHETPGVRELQTFARDNVRLAIHLNVLRYHLDRICEAAPGRALRVEWIALPGEERRVFEDVCAEPGLRWYLPLPLGQACIPRCAALIHRWARGEPPG